MAVHRSQIRDSHVLKQHSGNQKLLDAVFRTADLIDQFITDYWYPGEDICHIFLQIQISVSGPDAV